MHALSVALGFVIGFALGLLGGGGSILTVPIFVYILGFDAKASIAMSLAVVGVTSLVGAMEHWREGHVNLRVAVVFGAVAMVGTYLGTRLARQVTGGEQLLIFALIMLVAAGFMLRGRRVEVAPRDAPHAGSGTHSDPRGDAGDPGDGVGTSLRSTSVIFTAAQGLVVGSLTGLVGVGGGFLIVPALVWGGLAMSDAVGTSLLTIAMNCAVGFSASVGHVPISWLAVAMVTTGTLPGITAGTYAMRFVSQAALRRGFAVLLIVLAAYMLYRNVP